MLCQPYYEDDGRLSIPPGRYFRMLFVGQFEGLESEREIEWRCADSLSLHRFLRLVEGERVPDHSTLSVTRSRLPLEHAVFGFILEIANQHDLVPARRIGVDASTQQASASLRRLVRRDTGEDYQEMLQRLARASGIETPTTAELIRFDRARKNKTLSNADWETDPAARIAKMKDGRTRLGYKPEHAVDLDSEVIVAARIHLADQGDTQTLPGTRGGDARPHRRGADPGGSGRVDRRHRLPFPGRPEGAGGRRVEDAHIREAAERLCPLAGR
jgi:transposase